MACPEGHPGDSVRSSRPSDSAVAIDDGLRTMRDAAEAIVARLLDGLDKHGDALADELAEGHPKTPPALVDIAIERRVHDICDVLARSDQLREGTLLDLHSASTALSVEAGWRPGPNASLAFQWVGAARGRRNGRGARLLTDKPDNAYEARSSGPA